MTYPVVLSGETFVGADFAGYNYAANWERLLSALEMSFTQVELDAASAAASKTAAEAALATALTLTGGAQGIGNESLDVPRVIDLGSAAFMTVEALAGAWMEAVTASPRQIALPDFNKILVVTVGSATVTLPLFADVPLGFVVTIKNRSGGNITLDRNGTNINGAGSNLTLAGGSVTRVGKFGSAWETF